MPGTGRPWRRTLAQFKADCKRQNLPCWICRKPIDYTLTGQQSRAFSADHVQPGNDHRPSNLKPSHYGCNSRRGDMGRGDFPTSRQW